MTSEEKKMCFFFSLGKKTVIRKQKSFCPSKFKNIFILIYVYLKKNYSCIKVYANAKVCKGVVAKFCVTICSYFACACEYRRYVEK